ncbi:MAG TPA: PKD domain-containing protein [Gaiellaceae bacterium]|jgi:PKD domain
MLGTVLAACVTLVVVDSSRAEQRGIWLTSPANGAVVSGGGPVGLEFGTDWLTGVFPGRLMLQVARDPSFTDLVVDTTYECPASFEPSCPSTATIGPLADGTYVWRILWLSQPDGAPSSWIPSDAWTFVVGQGEVGRPPGNAPPVARIAFTPAEPHVGELVSFDGSASTDPDGTIVSYAWAFGNGNGATGSPLAAASFDGAGTYVVTLLVTDGAGASTQTSVQVTVGQPAPPVAAPPSAVDSTPPVVRALVSRGRSGSIVTLRYRVLEESGGATVDLVVRRRQLVLKTIHASVATTSGEPRFVRWRGPRRAGQLTLCVRAQDRAGNRSELSCAPVWIRA